MENNHLNKLQFFAQYYGQPVFKKCDGAAIWPLDFDKMRRTTNSSYLQLRPLASITDEEYFEIAILCGYIKSKFTYDEMVDNGHAMIAAFQEDLHISLSALDYLRSIGILIPYMGLSCEQILEYGWVKLTK